MTLANPVPQDAGITGPRLILILIFGTVRHIPEENRDTVFFWILPF